jgi:hypothetical protein
VDHEDDDSVYMNIVDSVFDDIQDTYPYLPFRIILKKTTTHPKSNHYWYDGLLLVKASDRDLDQYIGDSTHSKFNQDIQEIISKSNKRFGKKLNMPMKNGRRVDSWIYTLSASNGILTSKNLKLRRFTLSSREYQESIIYDLQSNYKEDEIGDEIGF